MLKSTAVTCVSFQQPLPHQRCQRLLRACRIMSEAAAAAVAPPSPPPSSTASSPGTPGRAKRQRAPKIDIDKTIATFAATVKEQKKLAAEAHRLMRNEKRKKQRLVKKAATLSSEDLQRIALLKRCGLYVPGTEAPESGGDDVVGSATTPSSEGAETTAASAASGSSSSSAAAAANVPAEDASD